MRIGSLLLFEKITIGDEADPILIRYVLFAHPAMCGVMVHCMRRSDPLPDMHDHPWAFVSLVLAGGYGEFTEAKSAHYFGDVFRFNRPGYVLWRPATWKHRVIITGKPCWTLVFRGPRVRAWGYWHTGGWCWWRKYNWESAVCEDGIVHAGAEINGN